MRGAKVAVPRNDVQSGKPKASLFDINDFRTVTYSEAEADLRLSHRQVQRMVKSGKLESTKLGTVKGVRIYQRSIDAYKAERTGL